LAVYGTLAPGRANAGVLEALRGSWSAGTVRGRRIAAGWGNAAGFPAVQLDEAGDVVEVAVFESADLPAHWARLDAFEGDEYERVIAPVAIGDRIVAACIYVAR
jgi:gamma-glutamylcyclotransferase (GGCT)/AIG2-like uncharacterized protein YtfP